MDQAKLSDYQWLVGREADRWLLEMAACEKPVHIWARRLRKELSASRTHLLLEQWELRRRATVKFVDAERMFFTRRLLEQATDQWVAAYKARRFTEHPQLVDLCCGIGGDLLALAMRGPVLAVDRDPKALILARANIGSTGSPGSSRRVSYQAAEAAECLLGEYAAWHIDPDRRPHGHRVSQPRCSSPTLGELSALLSQRANAAVKLAPAAEVPASWQSSCELEWISREGECKQLVAWHGELAQHRGMRRATILRRRDESNSLSKDTWFAVTATLVGQAGRRPPLSSEPRRFVYEPDAAVLAAQLTGEVARRHSLSALSANCHYLTADDVVVDRCLTCFEVCDVLPLDRRQLTRYFAARRIGRLEIKKRGVDLDPAQLRQQLKLRGENRASLIMTRVGADARAIVAQRVASTGPGQSD